MFSSVVDQAAFGAPASSAARQDYCALDDADLRDRFSRSIDGGLIESWLVVEGMYCGSCSTTIAQKLLAQPGVRAADVNAASGRARVIWDSQQTTVSAIFCAIASLNYRPFPVQRITDQVARRNTKRKALWRLFVAGFCMMQVMMYASPSYFAAEGDITADVDLLLKWASWMISLPVVLFASVPFFSNAWTDLRNRRIGMDVPVAIGIIVTFVASSLALMQDGGEVYFDSLTMFVFFLLTGRYLETLARGKAAESLESLATRLPERVDRFKDFPRSRVTEATSLHRLAKGDVVGIAVGQAFPGDCTILEGQSAADEALLTGESVPVKKSVGDQAVAGSYNLEQGLVVRLDHLGSDSRFGQILALMERAAAQKPRLAALVDRFAGSFLLCVLVLSAMAGYVWWLIEPARAVWIAVSILIVTCPCALSLATPAAVLAATGNLARRGVLVCHPDALETLADVDRAVFDKTGTLTDQRLVLKGITLLRDAVTREAALAIAAGLEARSIHPIAQALVQAAQSARIDATHHFEAPQELAGEGVQGQFDGVTYRLGKAAFAWPGHFLHGSDVAVLLADQSGPIASFTLGETLREHAFDAVSALRERGLKVSLLSGDRADAVATIAGALHIEEALAVQSPEDKLSAARRWQTDMTTGRTGRLLMVGDGINDGPILSCADVSIAMGSGAPLSQSRADIVLLSNRLADIPYVIDMVRRMRRVIVQNLCWAAAYNALCVPLALWGYMPPWLAGLGMALSSLLVVINALRLAR